MTPTTTFADLVKHKAETVGDKVFLTYVRDFDNNIDEKYTFKDIHLKSMLCRPSPKGASTRSNPLYPIGGCLQGLHRKRRPKNSPQLIELQPFS